MCSLSKVEYKTKALKDENFYEKEFCTLLSSRSVQINFNRPAIYNLIMINLYFIKTGSE